jgi:hypothetical protein
MKKNVILSVLILFILGFAGCGGGGSSSDGGSATGSITINATYTGSLEYTGDAGTKKIYVYLYEALPDNAQDASNPIYQVSTDAAAAIGVEQTITVDNIEPGSYYVVVFYDYKSHNQNIAGNSDRYTIYNSTQYIQDAEAVAVEAGSGDILDVTFGDSYTIQSDGKFMVKPGTVTVNAGYTGTAAGADGSQKIYVYLYSTLSDAQATPVYSGSTSGTVTSDGTLNEITISNVAPGSYYVVAFYDYSDNGAGIAAGEGDKYILSGGSQLTTGASAVTVATDQVKTVTMNITDAYSLQADGAFIPDGAAGTLTINTNFTGTITDYPDPTKIGTKKIYVYLYKTLSDNADTAIPDCQAVSSVVTVSGEEKTLTITNIPPDNYYVVVFYDYKKHTGKLAGAEDLYVLYNADDTDYHTANIVSEATSVTVSSGSVGTLTMDYFGDRYAFGSGGIFETVSDPEP